MVWVVLAAGVLIQGLAILVVLAWLRLAAMTDLLVLLLWRRAGQTPPQIVSQYSGRW